MFFYLGWQEEKKKEMLNLTRVIVKDQIQGRYFLYHTYITQTFK